MEMSKNFKTLVLILRECFEIASLKKFALQIPFHMAISKKKINSKIKNSLIKPHGVIRDQMNSQKLQNSKKNTFKIASFFANIVFCEKKKTLNFYS